MTRLQFRSAWRPFTKRVQPRPSQLTRNTSTKSPTQRIDRLTSKLPKRLQKYTSGLRNAPVSHIVSFLILHEITAIVPIFAFFGIFHYTNWVPVGWMTEHFGGYVQSGIARFERYFSRKGWFGFSRDDIPEKGGSREQTDEAMERWETGDEKYTILVEISLAYAVTKALLPLRIIASVSATPWFAGVLVRTRRLFTRKP